MAMRNITLSTEAQNIIDKIVKANVLNPMRLYELVGELYLRRENARRDIVSYIRTNVPLSSPLGLSQSELNILEAEYINVVKYCHDTLADMGRFQRETSVIHLPNELCDLLSGLVESKEDDTVFLPFAGFAEMAFNMGAKSISGFEFNPHAWAFDNIFLESFGIRGEIKLHEGIKDVSLDVLLSKQLPGKRYNHIVCFPPHISAEDDRHIAQYMQNVLENVLEEGGDMCLMLQLADLSNGPWKLFSSFLAHNCSKFNVAFLSLPAVLAPVTETKIAIVVIEKTINTSNTFFVMDADRPEFYTIKRETENHPQLDAESILQKLRLADNRYVKSVLIDDVMKCNAYFSPSRFFFDENLPKLKEGFEYVTLGSLVSNQTHPGEYIDGFRFPRRDGKYIRVSHLYDNYLSCVINYDAIVDAPISSSAYNAYANGGYATFLNGIIKVGKITDMYSKDGIEDYYNPNSDSKVILVDRTVAHFAPRPNGRALLDYILRELTSDYVLAQAKHFAFGTVKQMMLRLDFLKLKIAVPSIEVQDEILKQDRIDAVAKAEVKIDEINVKFRKDVHMMKHGLGQTVFNLGNWMKMLDFARKAGNGVVDDNAEIGGLVKVKVADIYNNIEAALKVLNRQITTFDMGDSMKKTPFSLTDFIDKYIEEHPRLHVRYDFPSWQHRVDAKIPYVDVDDTDSNNLKAIECPDEYLVLNGEALDYIIFSEEALAIIFDNIVSNAVAHGFTNLDREYVIHIDFEAVGTSYVLSISNNGDPLPAGKDPSEVFVWGKTAGGKEHAGIGGYQVKDLMEHFGGKAEIISTPDEEFTVTYKLTFTKTNLIDLDI